MRLARAVLLAALSTRAGLIAAAQSIAHAAGAPPSDRADAGSGNALMTSPAVHQPRRATPMPY
jgi:hypothetical protein